MFIVQVYQNSQYEVPCGGIFLGKWRSSFAGSSDRLLSTRCLAAAFFSVSGAALSQEVPIVK
jgi:hypothetical protein